MTHIGIVYLIINQKNLRENVRPIFYIGSKLDASKFKNYWGSSKLLLEDVAVMGEQEFTKVVLEKIEYDNPTDITDAEALFHKAFDVANSDLFYNLVSAAGPFHCENGVHTRDTVWMNDKIKNKRVPSSKVGEYQSRGFVLGRLVSTFNKGRIYINKNGRTKAVPSNLLTKYKKDGWSVGKEKGNHINKIWITNGTERKIVSKEDADFYLNNGWRFGWKE